MTNFIQGIYQEDPSRVYTKSYHNGTTASNNSYTLAKINSYNLYLIVYTVSSEGFSSHAAAIIVNIQTASTIYLWCGNAPVYWNSNTSTITLFAKTSVVITLVALG